MGRPKVWLYSDGSCLGNPGQGGCACSLVWQDPSGGGHRLEMSQGFRRTTNNRMELWGSLMGLEALEVPCEVVVTTDSRYVQGAIDPGLASEWMARGWRRKDGGRLENIDLWMRLMCQLETHRVTTIWVKGHSGHPENELCDELAKRAARDVSRMIEDEGYRG